jgi:hypothetical protein
MPKRGLTASDWRLIDHLDEALAAGTGQILMTNAPAFPSRMAVTGPSPVAPK